MSHFAFEEELMEEAGYPFCAAHKRVHEVFIKRVAEYRLRFQAGEDISDELRTMLSRWLFNHIRGDDQAYAEQCAPVQCHQRAQGGHRSQAQVVTHRDQAEVFGQPRGQVRCRGRAEDAGQVEGQRRPGIAHLHRVDLGQEGAARPVGQAHQEQAQAQEAGNQPRAVRLEQRCEQHAESDDQHAGHDHRAARAPAVAIACRQRDAQCEEQHAGHLHQQELFAAVAQHRGSMAEAEHRHQVEQHEGCERPQRAQQHRHRMVSQHRQHRQPHRRLAFQRLLEVGGLVDVQSHPQAQPDQQRAGHEGNAPAPLQEVVLAQAAAQRQEDAGRQQEAQRGAQLREHAVPGALARWCVLGGQQHRPTPLAAQPQSLAESAQRQQRRCPQPDLRMGRQQADQYRGQAHGQQCGHQGGLAADAITEVAEHRRAHRPGDERHREGRQRLQQCRLFAAVREEQVREHQHRGRGVDVEVIPFDRGSDECGGCGPNGLTRRRRRGGSGHVFLLAEYRCSKAPNLMSGENTGPPGCFRGARPNID
ncbi:hypothetical protein G6F57_014208 [Rhizopus arrhizus]|nr:hypothetical protein G6F57_014208 [Rhizopus arrhizus]